MLKDSDPVVQVAAAEALGQIEDPRAVQALLPMLKSSDAELRLAVAEALGQIEDARAVEALTAVVSDADPRVRRAAIEALGQLDDLKQAPKPLLAALQDPDPAIRDAAIESVGEIGDPAAVPALQRAYTGADVETRLKIIEAAEQIDGGGASGLLMTALKDPDPRIRKKAAEALGDND
jgi:HEAT repeat protein